MLRQSHCGSLTAKVSIREKPNMKTSNDPAASPPAEMMFYHLGKQTAERVMPALIEKAYDRGWRVLVQTATPAQLEALDVALWTFRENSFVPHGTAAEGFAAEQPVYLTTGTENPNGAQVVFLGEGTERPSFDGFLRVIYVFKGSDPQALDTARRQWKAARAAGHPVTYWQENDAGQWEKMG